MKLTRHARNRLRWIRRGHPAIGVEALAAALPGAPVLGYDGRGNRRLLVEVADLELIVIFDARDDVLVTLWVM